MADRLPIDFWASAAMKRKLEAALGVSYTQFLDRYDVDLRYIAGPRYVGPTLGDGRDLWGVERTTVDVPAGDGVEQYSEVAASPLADARTAEQIEQYAHWPSPDWYDYSPIKAQCERIRANGRVVVFMGDRLNRIAQLKPAMYLRGMENILMDLATREAIAEAIIARVKTFYLAYLERILDAADGGIDIVLTGDDFGSQHGLLISPAMWRRFLGPGFAQYVALAKRYGAKVMHHTCGSVVELIPDLIGCGLDVLQSLQPEAAGMALADLKRRFGRDLCFHGGISIQRVLPFGTPQQIRRDVQAIAEVVGEDGGYIFCTSHNIQADTPVANVVALMEAYHAV